ncbi:site-specific integrase [uncultured Bacteroides sp.]|uniref:tyrosine-type recombinase/integrase n=1 Tax=uncultured Bacteroides sp. TaxID=162156 RepID=UPI0023C11565|nr:site-specific integrase [uncultured Bacteroides sp.]MDE6172213.1 site-specific integrase [Bacteroides sp.]
MSLSKTRKGASISNIVDYTLPKLHTGKNWYVDFTCFDPADGRMRRKKYMLDSIPKISDRKKRAAEIIANATSRLRSGWNPWIEASTERQYAKFSEVTSLYIRYIEKLTSNNTLKKKTAYDYQSRMNMLLEYNSTRSNPITYIYQFDQCYISDFLDYILLDRDSTARTRNNYRTWLSAFCTWLQEKKYIDHNPTERIKALIEGEKRRSALTAPDLTRLKGYLGETNRHFLLACMMEYYTFIRPDELSNVRLSDINIKEQKVFISSTISKNRRDGMVGLNDAVIKMMIELEVFENPSHFYLFGKQFKPNAIKADSRIFREYFNKVRAFLKWPNSYQFYSLKDTGIRDLANSEGIVVARDQARHSDVATTNRYLKGDSLAVHEETKHFKGGL